MLSYNYTSLHGTALLSSLIYIIVYTFVFVIIIFYFRLRGSLMTCFTLTLPLKLGP